MAVDWTAVTDILVVWKPLPGSAPPHFFREEPFTVDQFYSAFMFVQTLTGVGHPIPCVRLGCTDGATVELSAAAFIAEKESYWTS